MHTIGIESASAFESDGRAGAAAAGRLQRPVRQERPVAWTRFMTLLRHGRTEAGGSRADGPGFTAPRRDLPLPPL